MIYCYAIGPIDDDTATLGLVDLHHTGASRVDDLTSALMALGASYERSAPKWRSGEGVALGSLPAASYASHALWATRKLENNGTMLLVCEVKLHVGPVAPDGSCEIPGSGDAVYIGWADSSGVHPYVDPASAPF